MVHIFAATIAAYVGDASFVIIARGDTGIPMCASVVLT